ncbi:hypothetical protein BDR05DRAFT_961676 [Suillus weaverae]|nr:hypothetical protein BDR05DRAFT_961676 [Suillus weaverae]
MTQFPGYIRVSRPKVSSCTVFALLDDHTDATHRWVHMVWMWYHHNLKETDCLFAWAIGEV